MGSSAKASQVVRRVVSNTGPLLHLSEARVLQILSHVGEIHIPKAVEAEMSQLDSAWRTSSWITVAPSTLCRRCRLKPGNKRGYWTWERQKLSR